MHFSLFCLIFPLLFCLFPLEHFIISWRTSWVWCVYEILCYPVSTVYTRVTWDWDQSSVEHSLSCHLVTLGLWHLTFYVHVVGLKQLRGFNDRKVRKCWNISLPQELLTMLPTTISSLIFNLILIACAYYLFHYSSNLPI